MWAIATDTAKQRMAASVVNAHVEISQGKESDMIFIILAFIVGGLLYWFFDSIDPKEPWPHDSL